jgi:cytochrome c553
MRGESPGWKVAIVAVLARVTGVRATVGSNPLGVAQNLDDDSIQALAAWISSL